MNNSQLFKQAHAMAKAVHVKGDCYRVTFGLCLRAIKAKPSARAVVVSKVRAIDWALVGFCSAMLLALAFLVCGLMAIDQMKERNKESFDALYSVQAQVQDATNQDQIKE